MTDYCTWWPDWIWGIYIGACCAGHDEAFGRGGGVLDFLRDNIDLGACVDALGLTGWGAIMTVGTTLLGAGFFRWRARRSG